MAKKKGKQRSTNNAAPPTAESVSSMHSEAFEAALNSVPTPIFLKLCRLCESKDGPFLNIFGVEQAIAKKIDILLPFSINEYDDLPHKICFRCSAKVEELHEFVQKCISAQENLQKVLGKKKVLVTKTKTRKLWEAKLNKSNMSNDDICNAVIEKAMAGIKDIPNPIAPVENVVSVSRKSLRSDRHSEVSGESVAEIPVKQPKASTEKCEEKLKPLRPTRSTASEEPLEFTELPSFTKKPSTKKSNITDNIEFNSQVSVTKVVKETNTKIKKQTPQTTPPVKQAVEIIPKMVKQEIILDDSSDEEAFKNINIEEKISPSVEKPENKTVPKQVEIEKPPFDIMSHVCTIKVKGVGVLFQCKLCNRNFLSTEVVMSHGCAKTGVPKLDFTSTIIPEQPKPQVNNIKYITNNVNHKSQHFINSTKDEAVKPRPKIGPASKVKKPDNDVPSVGMRVTPKEIPPIVPPPTPTPQISALPAIDVPPIPGMKSRYRLVPGPNNTFSLIEDSGAPEVVSEPPKTNPQPNESAPPAAKTRKIGPKSKVKQSQEDNFELNNKSVRNDIPYPVGLFQAVSGDSSASPQPVPTPVTFTTPAMKKQSYTVVQTGNPSKLLISTKPQLPTEVIEPPKPKSKRKKREERQTVPQEPKQPYNLTMEDVGSPKDQGFFTFINVDPLLQPSYVLPTDNTIQESQITTSSVVAGSSKQGKETYDCSMCLQKFSREKKLLAHIQAHYNKMDQDDEKNHGGTRKKPRRS